MVVIEILTVFRLLLSLPEHGVFSGDAADVLCACWSFLLPLLAFEYRMREDRHLLGILYVTTLQIVMDTWAGFSYRDSSSVYMYRWVIDFLILHFVFYETAMCACRAEPVEKLNG